MNQKLLAMMNEAEQELIRATTPDELATLDEDELIELHTRVRRARTKYTKLYRRRAGRQVQSKGARSGASAGNSRTRMKAEVFEDVLATVSRRLAVVAKQSAAALKAERLAAAASDHTGAAASAGPGTTTAGAQTGSKPVTRGGDDALKSPVRKRATASSRATKQRSTAKRNSR